MFDMMTVMAEGAWNGVTSEMLTGVLAEIKQLLPMIAPVVVGFIAFRKGWGFIKGAIKGA